MKWLDNLTALNRFDQRLRENFFSHGFFRRAV